MLGQSNVSVEGWLLGNNGGSLSGGPTSYLKDALTGWFTRIAQGEATDEGLFNWAKGEALTSAAIASALEVPTSQIQEWFASRGFEVLASGTRRVLSDGPAYLHKDEAVVPAKVAGDWMWCWGWEVSVAITWPTLPTSAGRPPDSS